MLFPNQVVEYSTELLQDFNRIGVIADGSCFFHAIFFALDPEYRKLNIPNRMEYIKIKREVFAESISKELFLSLANGNIAFMIVQDVINQLFELFIKKEPVNILNELYTLPYENTLTQKDVESYLQKYTSLKTVSELLHNFSKDCIQSFLQNHKNNVKTVVHIFNTLNNLITEIAYVGFKENLKNPNEWFGYEHIELVQTFLKLNVLIIDAKTNKLYEMGHPELYKYDESVILYWDGVHFELLFKDHQFIFPKTIVKNL